MSIFEKSEQYNLWIFEFLFSTAESPLLMSCYTLWKVSHHCTWPASNCCKMYCLRCTSPCRFKGPVGIFRAASHAAQVLSKVATATHWHAQPPRSRCKRPTTQILPLQMSSLQCTFIAWSLQKYLLQCITTTLSLQKALTAMHYHYAATAKALCLHRVSY